MRTVYGLFDTFSEANNALNDLLAQGYSRTEIGILTKRDFLPTEKVAKENLDDGAAEGAGVGAVIGGLTGLLAGLGALTIPGVGPIIAAGPLLTTVTSIAAGVGVGAVGGSLIGLLVDWGIPDDVATTYGDAVKDGSLLIAVQASDNQADAVEATLAEHNAREINIYQFKREAATAR